jgi:hypothetical protein
MNTIKRFYLYAVAFISFEVVLWGVIELVRSMVAGTEPTGAATRLAAALSLILVGTPVFLVHWGLAQRGASLEIEERSSRLRAIFLYGMLLATLLPSVQNTLALVNRQLASALNIEMWRVLVGTGQVLSDNLIAIAMNAAAALVFFGVLRKDWRSSLEGEAFAEVRRFYRYLWLIYGLGLLIFGSQQILQFLFGLPTAAGVGQTPGGIRLSTLLLDSPDVALLANGLTLVLLGTPLFAFVTFWVQRSLAEESERSSMLRLVVLYGLGFTSVVVVLVSTSMFLDKLLQWLLGESLTIAEFMQLISRPVSVALPFGLVWIFYGSALSREVNTLPDTPRRSGLRRLYLYVLALFGLAAAFIGVHMTVVFLVEYLTESMIWDATLRSRMASSLSTFIVGLPLWALTWRPMAYEARKSGEAGDHSRRSLVRKAYLYLFLFVGLMGVMFSGGMLIFMFLRTFLGDPPDRLVLEILRLVASLMLFSLLLAYHWQTLRRDVRLAESTLTKQHAQFPVLILAPEDNELVINLVEAFKRQVPAMPVSIHRFSQGVPDETLSAAKAVILPGELIAKPPEGLRLWLQTFSGAHLVLPTPAKGWHWVFGSGRPLAAIANQAARMVRQLAEGETLTVPRSSSSWMIVVYVLAFLFALQIVIGIASLVSSLFF